MFSYNLQTNEFELGLGKAKPTMGAPAEGTPRILSHIQNIGKDSFFFCNARIGVGAERSTGSVNFGVLNATISDPIVHYALSVASSKITKIASLLQAATLAASLETGGASLIGTVGVTVLKRISIQALIYGLDSVKWSVGLAWRGGELSAYHNGEVDLNFSGAKFKLAEGEGAGGSGLSPDDFIYDFSQ